MNYVFGIVGGGLISFELTPQFGCYFIGILLVTAGAFRIGREHDRR